MRPQESGPEQRLREALLARADEVEASPDALARIRMRTARARRRGAWAMIGAVAAVATAIAAGAVFVAGTRATQPPPPSASRPEKSDIVAPPSVTPSAKTVSLPVYFARNGRLYREFRPVTLAEDSDRARVLAAVDMSLRGESADPDYRTLWPAGVTVHGVTLAGGQVTVDLGDVGPGPVTSPVTSPVNGTADLAVQQLVYTVAAVSTYTSMKRSDGVRLLVDGAPVARLWGIADTGGVLRQAPMADVQAPVWVIEPEQGAVVGKSFTVYLAGIVPEGTVNLRIRGTGGQLVAERVVRLSAGAPALGEARVPLTLASGRYTVEAYFVSLRDGSIQWVDDHDFSVG
ncbi:GerMN domain-containing protein [Dactylosporangium sp. NPDC048998]|uniref:GerMN domain-containing protein n=1 Tax=Dactylosporangium sp. NPDC048998 TaxID=3363976 RepID=UPI003721344E